MSSVQNSSKCDPFYMPCINTKKGAIPAIVISALALTPIIALGFQALIGYSSPSISYREALKFSLVLPAGVVALSLTYTIVSAVAERLPCCKRPDEEEAEPPAEPVRAERPFRTFKEILKPGSKAYPIGFAVGSAVILSLALMFAATTPGFSQHTGRIIAHNIKTATLCGIVPLTALAATIIFMESVSHYSSQEKPQAEQKEA